MPVVIIAAKEAGDPRGDAARMVTMNPYICNINWDPGILEVLAIILPILLQALETSNP